LLLTVLARIYLKYILEDIFLRIYSGRYIREYILEDIFLRIYSGRYIREYILEDIYISENIFWEIYS